jgi:hypothetical protein
MAVLVGIRLNPESAFTLSNIRYNLHLHALNRTSYPLLVADLSSITSSQSGILRCMTTVRITCFEIVLVVITLSIL